MFWSVLQSSNRNSGRRPNFPENKTKTCKGPLASGYIRQGRIAKMAAFTNLHCRKPHFEILGFIRDFEIVSYS